MLNVYDSSEIWIGYDKKIGSVTPLSEKKRKKTLKTHLTLSSVFLAIGAFAGLIVTLSLIFYFLEPLLRR
jgi:hypothetical protein